MSLKVVGYLAVALGAVLIIPALVAGGALAFSFALPVLLVGLFILIGGKVFWDWKLTRDFGANSMNPRDLVDPGVDKNHRDQRQQAHKRRKK